MEIRLSGYLFLFPILIIQMMMLAMGVGIIVSALTTKYRDLAMLIGFGLQLWQYGTPVAYGLRLVPEKYMKIYMLNPMTPIITSFRYIFFGTGYFHAGYYGVGWGSTMILFVLGIVLFNKVERTFYGIPFKENRMAEKQIMVKIDHVSKEYRLVQSGEQHYGKIWNDSMQK